MVYLNESLNDFDLNQAWQHLSPQRQAYLSKFRRETDRRAGAAAYLLLRQGLEKEYDLSEAPVFSLGPHGKPYIEKPQDSQAPLHPVPIHFNLSHCTEAAACAIHTSPVGIDVETISAYDPQLLPATMNAAEQDAILGAENPALAYICLWTLKEAYLKFIGSGITDDLSNLFSRYPQRPWEALSKAPSTPFPLSESCKKLLFTLEENQNVFCLEKGPLQRNLKSYPIFYQTLLGPNSKYVCSICYTLTQNA